MSILESQKISRDIAHQLNPIISDKNASETMLTIQEVMQDISKLSHSNQPICSMDTIKKIKELILAASNYEHLNTK